MVREWFDVLSREILNPDYALFTQSADGRQSPDKLILGRYGLVFDIFFTLCERLVIFIEKKPTLLNIKAENTYPKQNNLK